MFKVGDRIKIIEVDPEAHLPEYAGRVGTITRIGKGFDGDIMLYGTWGGCSINANTDKIMRLEKYDEVKNKT